MAAMYIQQLRIQNFRCFEQVEIRPAADINVIVGDNASGKTSFLEAIYFLGRGQTFRRTTRPAIHRYAEAFTLQAEIGAPDARRHRLAVHRTRSAIQYKRDNQDRTSRLDLVNTLPLQLIDPNVHHLLEQGPRYRRHFMDWGVFHVEHAFFPAWRRYRRALRQRNRALRARWAKKDIISWDAELVRSGEVVDACRRRYIEHVQSLLPGCTYRLLGGEPVALEYKPGWHGVDGYGAALAANLDKDQRAGFTQQGPHRADLRVSVASATARDWVSRGQQKVLTAVLLLVQALLLRERRGIQPVLLIDDLAAELGRRYCETLASEIATLGGQCFLSFLDTTLIPDALGDVSMFHVEHGVVRPA